MQCLALVFVFIRTGTVWIVRTGIVLSVGLSMQNVHDDDDDATNISMTV